MPLLITEPSTDACLRFWRDADDVVTSRLTYVETAASIAQAVRMGRLSPAGRLRSLVKLDELWAEFAVVEADVVLTHRAAALADQCALRGHDAVQCASAEQVAADDLVAATGDRKLLAAWATLGVATFDPHHPQ